MMRCSAWMRLSPVSARTIARLAVDDRSRAQKRAHLRLLEQRADAAGEPGDDRILPADRLGEIELGRPDREADRVQRLRVAKPMRRVGGVDQRLRGDAADVEASSPEPVGLDQDRVEAELAGADRRDIAAGPAADDENLAAKLVHVLAPKLGGSSPPQKRGSRDLKRSAFRGNIAAESRCPRSRA